MTPLELLTLVMLSNSKPLRDSVDPAAFNGLASIVERLQADPKETLQQVLRDELGVQWDGAGKLGEAIVAECLRVAAIDRSLREIDRQILELGNARLRLTHQNIAGREAVDKTLAESVIQSAVPNVEADGGKQ